MTLLQAAFLGAVEGITEFLPISSTAHLVLTSTLLRIAQTDFQKSFEIIIQLGAILSVLVLYWRSFLRMEVLLRLFVAFLPTAVIGLLVYKILKQYLLGSTPVILSSLLLGGIALIVFEYWHPAAHSGEDRRGGGIADVANITWTQAVCIGLFQSVAIIPGVSRSAATIVGGLLLGIKRKTIVDFSFLLAVPTMAAATALDLLKSSHAFSLSQVDLLVAGFLASFVVALLSIVWLLRFIRSHTFVPFGIYRIVLVCAFIALLWSGIL
jgi:undecaprenyl-diphosphatase